MNNIVIITDQKAVTTSLIVAEAFEKQHKDVLRAISNLECSEKFTERNFAPSTYKDPTGRLLPMYNITRDGFSFLAMAFTGKKAAEFKEEFISAFNLMEKTLLEGAAKQINVNMNHKRGITSTTGVDIKFSTKLEKLIEGFNRSDRLEIMSRLQGVDVSDIIERNRPAEYAELDDFINDVCRVVRSAETPTDAIWAHYRAYAHVVGKKPLSQVTFMLRMEEMFYSTLRHGEAYFLGIEVGEVGEKE